MTNREWLEMHNTSLSEALREYDAMKCASFEEWLSKEHEVAEKTLELHTGDIIQQGDSAIHVVLEAPGPNDEYVQTAYWSEEDNKWLEGSLYVPNTTKMSKITHIIGTADPDLLKRLMKRFWCRSWSAI